MDKIKGVEPKNNDVNKGTAVVNYPVVPSAPPPEIEDKPSSEDQTSESDKPKNEK